MAELEEWRVQKYMKPIIDYYNERNTQVNT